MLVLDHNCSLLLSEHTLAFSTFRAIHLKRKKHLSSAVYLFQPIISWCQHDSYVTVCIASKKNIILIPLYCRLTGQQISSIISSLSCIFPHFNNSISPVRERLHQSLDIPQPVQLSPLFSRTFGPYLATSSAGNSEWSLVFFAGQSKCPSVPSCLLKPSLADLDPRTQQLPFRKVKMSVMGSAWTWSTKWVKEWAGATKNWCNPYLTGPAPIATEEMMHVIILLSDELIDVEKEFSKQCSLLVKYDIYFHYFIHCFS